MRAIRSEIREESSYYSSFLLILIFFVFILKIFGANSLQKIFEIFSILFANHNSLSFSLSWHWPTHSLEGGAITSFVAQGNPRVSPCKPVRGKIFPSTGFVLSNRWTNRSIIIPDTLLSLTVLMKRKLELLRRIRG